MDAFRLVRLKNMILWIKPAIMRGYQVALAFMPSGMPTEHFSKTARRHHAGLGWALRG